MLSGKYIWIAVLTGVVDERSRTTLFAQVNDSYNGMFLLLYGRVLLAIDIYVAAS